MDKIETNHGLSAIICFFDFEYVLKQPEPIDPYEFPNPTSLF